MYEAMCPSIMEGCHHERKIFSVTFTQGDLDVLQEALIGLRQQKESEAEDAKMLLAWIYKTKKEVDL